MTDGQLMELNCLLKLPPYAVTVAG